MPRAWLVACVLAVARAAQLIVLLDAPRGALVEAPPRRLSDALAAPPARRCGDAARAAATASFLADVAALAKGAASVDAGGRIVAAAAFVDEGGRDAAAAAATPDVIATATLASLFAEGPAVAVDATAAGAAWLAAHAAVLSVHADERVGAAVQPGAVHGARRAQALAGVPWGIDRANQRALPLDGAFAPAPLAGAGVDVYVIDSGVRASHAELRGRVDLARSANFALDRASSVDYSDTAGHGTHVAGVIAGATVGIAPAATIIALRVLDESATGPLSVVLAGLQAAIALVAAAGNATRSVCNLSFATVRRLPLLDAAVVQLAAACSVVVVAAGNSGVDACTSSPQGGGLVKVAASTSTDELASFSNVGTCVTVTAPGATITSASFASDDGFAVMSGTSMAAPLVAGAFASLLAEAPTAAGAAAALQAAATLGALNFLTASDTTPNALVFLPSCGWLAGAGPAGCVSPSPSPSASPSTSPSVSATPSSPSEVVAIDFRRAEAASGASSAHVAGGALAVMLLVAALLGPAP